MSYNHGIAVNEQETSLASPQTGTSGLQVVFGVSPINLVKNPYEAVNKLCIAHSFSEAVEQLGYSDDFKNYTLCQSMDACFRIFNIEPVIFCNVLDPNVHKKENEVQTVNVLNKQAIVNLLGILADKTIVKNGDTTLQVDVDYITSFNDNGYLVITLIDGGLGEAATTLTIESISIAPELVNTSDIIGGYDISTNTEKGLELVRQVYPKFQMTPGLLLAPYWSKFPEVGIALMAKCEKINGNFSCECLLDLDCSKDGATNYTKAFEVKNKCGYINKHAIVLYPQILVGEKQYAYSAIYGALVAYTDAKNGDIPNISPSNKLLGVSGCVSEDRTEITLDENQANMLNGQGIVTIINDQGWKSWGNNTSIYPNNTDPKDRWICCRRMFTWQGNNFIISYKNKVDDLTNERLIRNIVDTENIRGNSLKAQGKCAGMRIEFNSDENPLENILNGAIKFHQYLAVYTPAEYIVNTLEFDINTLQTALEI